MRWCLNWWRGSAAVLVLLSAFAASAPAGADDGKKDATGKPDELNPQIQEAGKLLSQGKIDEAYKELKEAVKKKPELPPARLMLARLMIASKIREFQPRIRPVLELAISENKDHPVVYLDNASYAMAEGRVTDAILNSEKALALGLAGGNRWTPEQKKEVETQARNVLAQAYQSRADWQAVRTQMTALLAKEPTKAGYRILLAKALFFMDDAKPDDAYQELVTAAKEDKEHKLDPPQVSMAKFYAMKGENKEARAWFDKAAKADDKKTDRVDIAYADWLMQQNEIQEAKLHVEAAAKVKPDDLQVKKFQGLIARVQKDYATAEKIFKEILNADPDDTFARNQLALILVDEQDKKQHELAVKNAELNTKANQKSPEAWATVGYVYYQTKRVDEALQALKQSVQAANGQIPPDTAYYLALCLVEKGQNDKALPILKEALASTKGLFVYQKEAKDLKNRLESKGAGSSTK